MSAPPETDLRNPNCECLFFTFCCSSSVLIPLYLVDDADVPLEPNLEEYVKTAEFDAQCIVRARERALYSDKSGDEDSDSVSGATTAEPAPHEVSKIEARLYYAGVGPRGRGPKLIYRTSRDTFEEPSGPEAYTRLMRAIPVPESHQFAQEGSWDTIRDKVRGLYRYPTTSSLTSRA